MQEFENAIEHFGATKKTNNPNNFLFRHKAIPNFSNMCKIDAMVMCLYVDNVMRFRVLKQIQSHI